MWYREVTMYDFSELVISRKEMAVLVLVVFIFMVVVFSAGYCVGLWHGNHISDNGTGIDHVGEQLGEAVGHQQQITDGIKDAEHTSSGIAETSAAIKESAVNIEAGVGEAAGLIDSSQQILGRIRNRGQANPPAN